MKLGTTEALYLLRGLANRIRAIREELHDADPAVRSRLWNAKRQVEHAEQIVSEPERNNNKE